mmetsp:Transcript_20063/g.29829  ORF Transcript_20063/g.29829 Transcript_20063/m.29829 type:complete len:341 (+) Transcript_20063:2-1024(+)
MSSSTECDFNTISKRLQSEVQDAITEFIKNVKGSKAPHEDTWDYHKGSGGGITRVWEETINIDSTCDKIDPTSLPFLEKGGVNFSSLSGNDLPTSATTKFNIPQGTGFQVCGVSLVFHPVNPFIPTIHMNVRYFQADASDDLWWFGGGIDLTTVYPQLDQVKEFHASLESLCNRHSIDYAHYKKVCDQYFFLSHRNEARGVGGIFFDHFGPKTFPKRSKSDLLEFVLDTGKTLIECYKPIVEANLSLPFTMAQREFQLWRRSRYVEFNLLFDRGTKFGIQSKGRTESILMSMPATANWRYAYDPIKEFGKDSPEAISMLYLKARDWQKIQNEKDLLKIIE